MLNGIEVDMLSLGDADCILVSQWTPIRAFRVLIDSGCGADAEVVKEFLHNKSYTNLDAVVCSHLHNDHCRGLVKLVQDRSINICMAWMHDIRKHISPDDLRRASSGSSPQAEAVKKVVEATEELARAFTERGIPIQEPFAGQVISYAPILTVLGPDEQSYKRALEEFTKVEVPFPIPSFSSAASLYGLTPTPTPAESFWGPLLHASLFTPPSDMRVLLPPAPPAESVFGSFFPPSTPPADLSALLEGVLGRSSVKENPSTQPFNNTVLSRNS